ncbi:MAG TPA: SDR family NAD(P)-dependent oxidoreductase [Pyrinomonadaceae bacterium]|nr:SDR family NAD(P)-dependent oxidoreductase [Pyrinomonadaceae bacterium]
MTIAPDGIAIIGMAGRFPGAPSVDALWKNLQHGVESITRFSDDELLEAGVLPESLRDPDYVKAGPTLAGIDLFDAPMFNLSPAEAEIMDPQHRLFLECALASLENAGYSSDRGQERIGVYGGTGINRYLLEEIARSDLMKSGIKSVTGNDKDYLTARVSYKLGLTGPSICVQSACSTSLVAVHLACRSLLDQETDIALAGGVSLRVPQTAGYWFEEGGILSPDGHCRAFDAEAGGTIFGSGVGIVVLKRLEEAIADGDAIHAVIRGSAVNNDGSAKAGFTAPSVQSQAELITEALLAANVDPRSISYVEAHGTGTNLGDPIELSALTKAYRGWTRDRGFCAIGSVKTNVGHLDTAAGVTGLIKTVMTLEHKRIPPSLNYRIPNPEIDFDNSSFYVNTTLREWTTANSPRRAGVSSFGLGGTNCHMILEEAPPIAPRVAGSGRRHYLIPVSAKNNKALEEMCDALADHISQVPETRLDDVAFSYQQGRKTYPHRRVVVARSREQALDSLRSRGSSPTLTSMEESITSPVAFLFPGQGSQFANMGLELYDNEPVFRRYLDTASEILKSTVGFDLRVKLFPARYGNDSDGRELDHTSVLQPALFTFEYALAQLWQSWGVHPDFFIGHSLGEFVAATLAGVMSFEAGLQLVARRGSLIGGSPTGTMLALPLKQADVLPLLGQDLSIAALNGPERTVVSGPPAAVLEFEETLSARDVPFTRLSTSHAFHSRMMEAVVPEFRQSLRSVTLRPPQSRYISNVTGTWITAAEATDPEYWIRHLLEPVRFFDGLRTLGAVPRAVLLEVGPGRVLTGLAKSGLRDGDAPKCLISIPDLKEVGATEDHLHRTLGELWLAGVPVNWSDYQKDSGARRVPLPGYAFQRERYWISSRKANALDAKAREPETEQAQTLLLTPMWRKFAPAAPSVNLVPYGGVTVVVYEQNELAQRIVEKLRLGSAETVFVQTGSTFQQLDNSSFTIDAGNPRDYQKLFGVLASRLGDRPLRVVHLLNLTYQPQDYENHINAFYSLIWIAQNMGSQLSGTLVDLVILSAGAHSVTGRETLSSESALIAGPFQVIPREYPNYSCRWIDIDPSEYTLAALDELLRSETDPDESIAAYAYRDGKRYERSLAELRLPAYQNANSPFRQYGVYLITGGFGGIGVEVAQFLAREHQAKLVLTGRTTLPERSQWDEFLSKDSSSTIAQRLRTVLKLEALGSEVLPLTADVADEVQMRAAIEQAESRFGTINGVIHAAGIAGGELIAARNNAVVESGVFQPKVEGARMLAKVFSLHTLDFFVCCSSVQSLIGDIGQSDYCSANAFLDAFAYSLRASGSQPCLSVNWDTWRDVGMAADLATGRNGDRPRGLSPSEGISILCQLLSTSLPQAVVCGSDLAPRLKEAFQPRRTAPLQIPYDLVVTETAAPHTRPELFTPYIEPETSVERVIAGVWREVLNLDRVGLDDSLFELGGDSILAIRVSQMLEEKLGIPVPPVQIFAATTVRGLATLVGGSRQVGSDLKVHQNRGELRRANLINA